jgi:hypothetical protein
VGLNFLHLRYNIFSLSYSGGIKTTRVIWRTRRKLVHVHVRSGEAELSKLPVKLTFVEHFNNFVALNFAYFSLRDILKKGVSKQIWG